MPGVIATNPKYQFSDSLGAPLAGGSLTTYVAGTNTLTNTWQDQAQSTLNTNPILLDARGECLLWLSSSVTYKFVLKNSAGVTQWTVDNVAQSIDSSLVYYLPTGGTATTVQAALRSIGLGSSPAHPDGAGNTLTGSQRLFIGNNTPSADDSALLIGRGLTGSYNLGAHAVRDESTVNYSGSGFYGYASFDAIATATGSNHWNHINAFQARQTYSGSGNIDGMDSFQSTPIHSGTGTVDLLYGLHINNPLGAGPININTGIYIENLTRGAANYAIFSGSTSLPSYHGGRWQMGTAPQIDVAGFKTAYGGLLGVDTSGNILPNPNLTIINGLLTMANATTSRILSSTAQKLQLDATVIVEAQKPLQLPVYTVATLPSPASAYTYCRAFVSDANATTFNSIVAAGGANKVPVFSDGTNWRIG